MARWPRGAEHLYVSVDIDVLDPGFAPGTTAPEPGGLAPADLLRTVRALAMRTNLVALDVVEVAPPYDVSDNTVNNAHRVVFEARRSGVAAAGGRRGSRPAGHAASSLRRSAAATQRWVPELRRLVPVVVGVQGQTGRDQRADARSHTSSGIRVPAPVRAWLSWASVRGPRMAEVTAG